jgi:hypothetical protein
VGGGGAMRAHGGVPQVHVAPAAGPQGHTLCAVQAGAWPRGSRACSRGVRAHRWRGGGACAAGMCTRLTHAARTHFLRLGTLGHLPRRTAPPCSSRAPPAATPRRCRRRRLRRCRSARGAASCTWTRHAPLASPRCARHAPVLEALVCVRFSALDLTRRGCVALRRACTCTLTTSCPSAKSRSCARWRARCARLRRRAPRRRRRRPSMRCPAWRTI